MLSGNNGKDVRNIICGKGICTQLTEGAAMELGLQLQQPNTVQEEHYTCVQGGVGCGGTTQTHKDRHPSRQKRKTPSGNG